MDQARKKTDKKLAQMERKVDKIYKEAYADISKNWNEYMAKQKPKLDEVYRALEEAKRSGDREEIAKAKDAYERKLSAVTINDQRYKDMVADVTEKISHTNEVALAYLNNNMAGIYALNYNALGAENIKGYSFALTNEQAVKTLAMSDKALLPTKKLNIPKDERWNAKAINSQMLQGIIQGESIPKMARRLQNVVNMDRKSAIRNARTMTTSAENKGRQDSFRKAEEDGVIMTRMWVSAHDSKTRDWHAELDGVEVDVDEPWENDYGEIMYPGDPSADPANVYNCRCSIRAHVKGFKWNGVKVPEPGEDGDAYGH